MNRLRAVLVSSALVAAASSAILLAQADVFATLGSSEAQVREQVFDSFLGGSVYPHGAAKAFRSAGADARASMVKAVVGFARRYTESADFAKRYATHRSEQKPPAAGPAKTGGQMQAEQRKALEEAIANAKKMAAQMPSMKADMDAMAKQLQAQLDQMAKDEGARKQLDQLAAQVGEAEAAEQKRKLAEWEKRYPADPKVLVAARLREFLDMSATVDFAAATAPTKDGRSIRFVNAAYEAKDSQWKMMYRAGKPEVEAARALAKEWLQALGR